MQARRTELTNATTAQYTLQFKQEAVQRVKGQRAAATAKILAISEQMLLRFAALYNHQLLKSAL